MYDTSYLREQSKVDELNQRYHQQSGGKGWVYWMYVIRDGRPTVLGYQPNIELAHQYLYTNAPNEVGEVICLDTTDLSSAVRKIKSHILETSHSLDAATVRMVRKQFKSPKPKKKKVEVGEDIVDVDPNEWEDY